MRNTATTHARADTGENAESFKTQRHKGEKVNVSANGKHVI
jgi:hypothetical protein